MEFTKAFLDKLGRMDDATWFKVGIVAGAGTAALGGALYLLQKNYNSLPVRPHPHSRLPTSHYPVYRKGAKVSTTDPTEELPIMKSEKGLASIDPVTIPESLKHARDKKPNAIAMNVERNGTWQSWTYKQYYDDVVRVARSLIALGVEPAQGVGILGFNSPEWFMMNLGAIFVGALSAGIYTTNEREACQYIASHADARVILCDGAKQAQKIIDVQDQLNLSAIVVYNDGITDEMRKACSGKTKLYSWEEFLGVGASVSEGEVDERVKKLKPGKCSTLIYTSGTTGPPKAVMLSHDNITWVAAVAAANALPPGCGDVEEHLVSYLPLSHVAGQMIDMYLPIYITGNMRGSCQVWFARPDALKGSLGETLKHVRPTIFFGVPRVFEKIEEKMRAVGAQTKGVKKMLATWAKAQGLTATRAIQVDGNGFHSIWFRLAYNVILSKVHEALGFSRVKMLATGAAPISIETLDYFGSLYLPILELYGMSESSGPQTVSTLATHQFGSCGRNMDGCELKVDHVSGRDKFGEGELCFRGRHIMMGYKNDLPKTRETIDEEGWLHSGDVGRLDHNGLLRITGRIKELIVTAGGENVAPVPIEDHIKQLLPEISQAVVIGDRRKFLVVLLTLRSKVDEETGEFTDKLDGSALSVDADAATVAAAKTSEKWREHITKGIEAYNKRYAVSNAQKVQKFAILDRDFSTPSGELTPTLKLKRPVVAKKYSGVINNLYA